VYLFLLNKGHCSAQYDIHYSWSTEEEEKTAASQFLVHALVRMRRTNKKPYTTDSTYDEQQQCESKPSLFPKRDTDLGMIMDLLTIRILVGHRVLGSIDVIRSNRGASRVLVIGMLD
jgi:hypothetical protein